jgi:hypothetical protein
MVMLVGEILRLKQTAASAAARKKEDNARARAQAPAPPPSPPRRVAIHALFSALFPTLLAKLVKHFRIETRTRRVRALAVDTDVHVLESEH